MLDFMKKKEQKIFLAEDFIVNFSQSRLNFKGNLVKTMLVAGVLMVLAIPLAVQKRAQMTETALVGEDFLLSAAPAATVSTKKNVISIPTGIVKANPFVPYRKLGDNDEVVLKNDVPKFDLIEPPEFAEQNSEIAKVMDTTVSGILYDKHSPSAILNIDGNDYLVKTGDVVHNYKVLNILQDSVTVQLGKNTYKAGIGEYLSDGSVTYNDVSNLNKKFGGDKR